jgi:3-oxoacyl-[acyl-carrier protein] reductase
MYKTLTCQLVGELRSFLTVEARNVPWIDRSFIQRRVFPRPMDLGLQGKVALVAAASQGMGRAVALNLAREGCRVAICARNAAPLEVAAQAIRRETGAEVLAVPADVSRIVDATAFVDKAHTAYGGIDILVVNAGGPPTGRFEVLTEEQWTKAYDLTLMSAVRLIRAAVPVMRARGCGSIVAITSISVKQPLDNLLLSNAMRAAVVGLVKTLARELGPDGIRVNAVAPGFVATERLVEVQRIRAEREGRPLEAIQAEEARSIPLGRFGRPEEIADAVAYLVSPRSSYLSGNVVQVDGGLYRGVH